MRARLLFTSTLPLLAALLAGCNFDFHLGEATPGQIRRADFAYVDQNSLIDFGGFVDQAMMVGTTELIAVSGKGLPADLTATTGDPKVAEAKLTASSCCVEGKDNSGGCFALDPGEGCDGDIQFSATVVALGPGATELVLRRKDGSVFDGLPLLVAPPASLQVSCDGAPGPIQLSKTASCAFAVTVFDATNTPLRATSGFVIQVADPKVALLRSTVLIDLTPMDQSEVVTAPEGTLLAHAPGKTELTIEAGALTAKIPVESE